MSLWSWVRALTEAKEKGMGHAPIACEWDHPSSEWARGWGPYKESILTLDYLKVGLVIPYFVQDELGILPWVWIIGLRCMDTGLGVRKLT